MHACCTGQSELARHPAAFSVDAREENKRKLTNELYIYIYSFRLQGKGAALVKVAGWVIYGLVATDCFFFFFFHRDIKACVYQKA